MKIRGLHGVIDASIDEGDAPRETITELVKHVVNASISRTACYRGDDPKIIAASDVVFACIHASQTGISQTCIL
jgi:hypothetical protein